MVHPCIAKFHILVQGGAKVPSGKTQHDTCFSGNRVAVILLRTKACFGKKASPRALQDDLRPISGAANQSDFTGDDTKYALQRISEPEQRFAGFDSPVLGNGTQPGRNGRQSGLRIDQRLPVHG